MPDGCREGRITPGFAGIVLAVAMTAGCGRLPVHPFGPVSIAEPSTPERRPPPHLPGARPKGRWNSRSCRACRPPANPSSNCRVPPPRRLCSTPHWPARRPARLTSPAPAEPASEVEREPDPAIGPRAREGRERRRSGRPDDAPPRPIRAAVRDRPPRPIPRRLAAKPSADPAPSIATGRSREAGRGAPRLATSGATGSNGFGRSSAVTPARRRPLDAPRPAAGRARQGRRRRRRRGPLEDRLAGPRRHGRAPGARGVARASTSCARPSSPWKTRRPWRSPTSASAGRSADSATSIPWTRPPSRRARPSSSIASCRAFAARPEATDSGRGWPRNTRSSPRRGANPSSGGPRWVPPRTSAGGVGATITPIIGSTSPRDSPPAPTSSA